MYKTIVVLCLMLIAIPCFGSTYYVTQNGNDANNGQGWDKAWLTIDKINSNLQAGDTVRFGSGVWYQSTIVPPIGGMNKGRTVYSCSTYSINSERQATISAGTPLTNWINYSGNIYYAQYNNWGADGSYIVTQADSQLVYSGSISGVDSHGKFFEDRGNNRIYVWCFGNANPNTQTMVVGKSGKFVVAFNNSAQDKITFFGLRLTHGSHAVIHVDAAGCDSNEFKHCTMAYWGAYSGANTSAWLSEQSTLDSAKFGKHTLIQSCSLFCGMTEMGRIGAHTVATYGQHRVIIDSCVVHSSGNGIYFKDQLGSPIHYGNRISYSTIYNMKQTGVQWTSHVYKDSVYGNIIRNCHVGINNLHTGSSPIYGHFFIANNTIYGSTGVGVALYDDPPGCGSNNEIKYNIIAGSVNPEFIIGFRYITTNCMSSYSINYNLYNNSLEWFDVAQADHSFSNWQAHGYDLDGENNIDPSFVNPPYDFTRECESDMYAEYAGKIWTKRGAIQSDSVIIIIPPDTTDQWTNIDRDTLASLSLKIPIKVGNTTLLRDGDNQIDIDDVIFLVAFVFTGGPQPPIISEINQIEETEYDCYEIDGDTTCTQISVSQYYQPRIQCCDEDE